MTRQKFILRADGTISIASLALRAQSPNSVSPLCFCLEPEQYAHSATPECDITHTRRALLRPALGIHSFLFRIFAPQLLSAFRADEATTLLSTRTINAARMTTNNPLVRWRSRGWPELCRFSDAGDDEAGHRLEDRRLKSAEARNRGKWGHGRCRGLYGDLTAASVGRGWSERPPNCFASQDGCG